MNEKTHIKLDVDGIVSYIRIEDAKDLADGLRRAGFLGLSTDIASSLANKPDTGSVAVIIDGKVNLIRNAASAKKLVSILRCAGYLIIANDLEKACEKLN